MHEPVLPTTEVGPPDASVTVVLLHGVGFGPESFEAVARRLADAVHVVRITRPGYGRPAPDPSPPPSVRDLHEQMHLISDTIEATVDRDQPVVLAGASGGATLGLALALTAPDRWSGAVLHEPLVGPAAPALHASVAARAAELADRADAADRADVDANAAAAAAVDAFVEGLVGPTAWAALPDAARSAVRARAAVVRAEVPAFARFAPSTAQLAGLRGTSLVTTVGAASPAGRVEAAQVLADVAGAEVVVVPGAAHLVQFEQPEAWADVIVGVACGVGRR